MPLHGETASADCSISEDPSGSAEIRTKVFRRGAPLLRSTIPVSLRGRGGADLRGRGAPPGGRGAGADQEAGDSDVESVMSLSDADEFVDMTSISVTLSVSC